MFLIITILFLQLRGLTSKRLYSLVFLVCGIRPLCRDQFTLRDQIYHRNNWNDCLYRLYVVDHNLNF